MAVIADGMARTIRVPYENPEFTTIDASVDTTPRRTVQLSASMVTCPDASAAGLFDADYYDLAVGEPFRTGSIGEAPVLPGTGLFMPAGTAAGKDKGLFRRTVPIFDASVCTGCMDCALTCPDAAIPNAVHELHSLLSTGISLLEEVPEAAKTAMTQYVVPIAELVRDGYRHDKQAGPFSALVARAIPEVVPDQPGLRANFARLVDLLDAMPVARTRPFFDAMEAEVPGSGGLYSVTIDPWKCSGCLECVDICGPHALTGVDQTSEVFDSLSAGFAFFQASPNTPARFTAQATTEDGDIKRLFLDRANYYAVTGGHGGCRGCGEVTGTRAVVGVADAVARRRQAQHRDELTELMTQLSDKLADIDDPTRRARIQQTLDRLDADLFRYESGPTGQGPSGSVLVNSTGCSSVYGSTMPYNPFTDPWVNTLFQDAQPAAKGVFEGLASKAVDEVRALRTARLELADAYDPAVHDRQLEQLTWQDFTSDELALMPAVITIGGDGATYDIGFGALSRILASGTPLKVMVLDTGGYSNTGGQASTASFLGQDADLARVGAASHGKAEARKELGILSSFHANTYVADTTTALQAHYLRAIMDSLDYTQGAAVLNVYAACQAENGLPDQAASRHARAAVESRTNPVFVHDPRKVSSLHDWVDLDGNPDPDKTWADRVIPYLDEAGKHALLTVPYTPADFAVDEVRFARQFHRLLPEEEQVAVPIADYIDLGPADQAGHVPFVWRADDAGHLGKWACSQAIVRLVVERRENWQRLQYLGGVDIARLQALHSADLADLQARYDAAVSARETSLDEIAQAMSRLASATDASMPSLPPFGLASSAGAPAPAGASAVTVAQPGAAPSGAGQPIVTQSEDLSLCNNCKTCYQEVPELFERATVIIDGEPREVGRIKPDAVASAVLTDDLARRLRKVIDNCDGEIIK
jgi:pyruvate-ferredoxin/flavodoxin oxidoreductase